MNFGMLINEMFCPVEWVIGMRLDEIERAKREA
jgi:hypothetical protein